MFLNLIYCNKNMKIRVPLLKILEMNVKTINLEKYIIFKKSKMFDLYILTFILTFDICFVNFLFNFSYVNMFENTLSIL